MLENLSSESGDKWVSCPSNRQTSEALASQMSVVSAPVIKDTSPAIITGSKTFHVCKRWRQKYTRTRVFIQLHCKYSVSTRNTCCFYWAVSLDFICWSHTAEAVIMAAEFHLNTSMVVRPWPVTSDTLLWGCSFCTGEQQEDLGYVLIK